MKKEDVERLIDLSGELINGLTELLGTLVDADLTALSPNRDLKALTYAVLTGTNTCIAICLQDPRLYTEAETPQEALKELKKLVTIKFGECSLDGLTVPDSLPEDF